MFIFLCFRGVTSGAPFFSKERRVKIKTFDWEWEKPHKHTQIATDIALR